MLRWLSYSLIIVLLAISAANADSAFEEGNRRVRVQLVTDRVAFQPAGSGFSGLAGVHFIVEDGWHIYWENSGEAGQPTTISWSLPAGGWSSSETHWPVPLKFIEKGEIRTFGYKRETLAFIELFNPPVEPSSDEQLEVSATVSWLVCKDICVPGHAELKTGFLYSTERALELTPHSKLFSEYGGLLPKTSGEFGVTLEPRLVAGDKLELAVRGQTLLPSTTQFFPREFSPLLFGEPRLSGDDKIVVPLAQRAGKKPDTLEISGVVAFAGDPKDLGFDWKLSLTREQLEALPLKSEILPGEQLTLRLIDYSGEGENAELPTQLGLFAAILAGIIAGMVLNLMPCVLPVLSLKIMSLSLNRDLGVRERAVKSLAYLGGIEATFLILALLVGLLRSLGLEIGWGFQFQHPEFVFVLALVVLLFALGFFDLYFVNLPGASKLDKIADKSEQPLIRSFSEGVLITLLSTPCTAPFLGTALAFAFTQPVSLSVVVFLSIGLGLGLPYMIVALVPALSRLIPRPGEWMAEVRIFMGFLLLASVLWLVSVLDALRPGSGLPVMALFLWISFLVWLSDPLEEIPFFKNRKRLRILSIALAISVSLFYAYPPLLGVRPVASKRISGSVTDWPGYTPELAERLTKSGKYVFVDFTADWCISCKYNEKIVLNSAAVSRLFAQYDISLLKADWTNGSEIVTKALERYGGHGVPLYVLLAPDGRVEVLPTLLTVKTVEKALAGFVKKEISHATAN
jgi:thiol:disulfide interchange protein DsbD